MSPEAAAPAIRVASLTKRYGGVEAVRGIDLTVEAGEIFGEFSAVDGLPRSSSVVACRNLTAAYADATDPPKATFAMMRWMLIGIHV